MNRQMLMTALLLAGPLTAQQPPTTPQTNPPPVQDSGRIPITGGVPQSGGVSDSGRIPFVQGAGTGVDIQSFPQQPAGPIGPSPYYAPPRPILSPYLNQFRGNPAIDYYNFVRPGQQAMGSYIGRPYGQSYQPNARYGYGYGIDAETGIQTFARPAGTGASFMNYGSYFNRLGTIGSGGIMPGGNGAAPATTQNSANATPRR